MGPALALAACVVPDDVADDAALDAVLEQLPQCQRDAGYLASVGHLLNQHRRYVEAADHLERALMLEPEMKGAKLDYAISLSGAGDVVAAKSLLGQLLADPTLPAQLRPALERQQAAWIAPTDWQHRVLLNARVGHDSNLLGSPNLSALTLTFPGQSIELPLDDTYRARAGLYYRVDLQLELRRDTPGGGHWESYAGIRTRRSPSVPDANSLHMDAAFEYSSRRRGTAAQGYYVGGSVADLDARSGIKYRSYGAAGGWSSASLMSGCEAKTGAEVQERRYLNNDLLSGRYSGLSASLSCDRNAGSQWLVSAKGGSDRARNADRAGGNQAQYALRTVGVVPAKVFGLPLQGQLWLDLELNYSRDSSSYSPLLDSGRLRSVQRANARVEYQFPLGGTAQGVLGAEWAQQRSSLALFTSRSWGPYAAVRMAW